jgi:rhamnulokinase
MGTRVFATVDLGASAGRVMAGVVERDHVGLKAVHRFPNRIVDRDGHLRWDLSRLFREAQSGLARLGPAESIGIDSWGVDYGLLDADGQLLAEPVAYRDDRTAKVIDGVHAVVTPERLYGITGLQFLPFNTVYQLAAERTGSLWPRAAHAVLVPDLLAYWLTGRLGSELTIASTTGLLDVHTGDWSDEVLDAVGIRRDLLPAVRPPAEIRGHTDAGTPVITVGSHDTASAVVAVPATTDRFAYVSSGTWSLVGLELDHPVVTDEARRANFTNEAGVDGRIRFLRNVGGLWLLQECLREWPPGGTAGVAGMPGLLAAAAGLPPGGPLIDVGDPAFIPPGDMPGRISAAAGRGPLTREETVRCILDSLAAAYARAVEQASELTGQPVDVVHVVGGGARNELLCQLTADATSRPVLAGPAEATALGNVLIQARAAGAAPPSLEALRAAVAASIQLRRYDPS